MSNIIKNSIFVGLLMSFFTCNIVFSQSKSNFNVGILNKHNQGQIIYMLDDGGNLIKLKDNYKDVVPDDLPKLSAIYVNDSDFVALTKDNEIISSFNSSLLKQKKIKKIDKLFLLTEDGKVLSFNNKLSKKLKGFKKVKDIVALSEKVVLIEEESGTFNIVGNGTGGIDTFKKIKDVSEAAMYGDDLILIIKKDGSVAGIGNAYEKVSHITNKIKDAEKFIKQDKNLYIVTSENKAIPIIEMDFKAPKEYLNDVSDIVIDKFATGDSVLYKAYFVTSEGKIHYYIQSNNNISEFSENKIKYINTFDNVKTVYESGYFTIVLHRDGSITIPYDINHELNGITGVKKVILNNQSYVVYLEDGQVITSLDNFVLNKKIYEEVKGESSKKYNYFNKMYVNLLNKTLGNEEYKLIDEYVGNSKEKLKVVISKISLDRRFLLLSKSYKEIMDILYDSILNIVPSQDEYNHMQIKIVDEMIENKKSKAQIVEKLVEYIFENPVFENIVNSFI